MSLLRVRNSLETHLAAFATANSNIPVVWENIKTIPSGNYLKAFLFPAATQDPSFGTKHKRYTGLFRVTYYTTELNVGMFAATTFAESLADHFPRGLQIVSGGLTTNITNTPSVSTPAYEATYMYITVDILYRAEDIKP